LAGNPLSAGALTPRESAFKSGAQRRQTASKSGIASPALRRQKPRVRPCVDLRLMLVVLALAACARPGAGAAEERWIKVSADPFTILTPADEASAGQWAVQLDEFRRGLQAILPVPASRVRPVTVVLFRNDRAMEPYVPLEKGRPQKIAGLFVRTNDLNTIMVSLAHDPRETRRLVFHEAVHWHEAALDVVLPLWLYEGLAELYSTFELTDAGTYRYGAPIPRYVRLLRGRTLLPVAELLKTDRSSVLYNEGNAANLFYAESWALTHFVFFGADGGREAFTQVLRQLQPEERSADTISTRLTVDEPARQAQFQRYLRAGEFREFSARQVAADAGRKIASTTATRAEIELAQGSLLFAARGADAAEPHLKVAAELAPTEPRAWELLGYVALERKDFMGANTALSRAVSCGSASPLVFYNLGISRQAGTTNGAVENVRLDPKLMDTAAADFRRALELRPSHIASYEALAGMIYSMATFRPDDVALLRRGRALAGANPMIEVGIAAGEIRLGHDADGRAALRRLGAGDLQATRPATRYARQIIESEDLRAELRGVDDHLRDAQFDEAIAIVDRAVARNLDPLHRQAMVDLRRRVVDLKKIHAAEETARRGDPAAARRMLTEVVASLPEATVVDAALRAMSRVGTPGATAGSADRAN
jgi:tetratricopeptide (TPR) repeat protein